jgi:hypothetical protein
MVTGGGRFSLDASVVPALRRRFDPGIDRGNESDGRPAAD